MIIKKTGHRSDHKVAGGLDGPFTLDEVVVHSRLHHHKSVWVVMSVDGTKKTGHGMAAGAMDSAIIAISEITGLNALVISLSVHVVANGNDGSVSSAYCSMTVNGLSVVGHGHSADLVEASVAAYVDGLNRYFYESLCCSPSDRGDSVSAKSDVN